MNGRLPETLPRFLERTGNLLIHLLDRCNLSCRHCYLNASPAGTRYLPFELALRTVNEAHELGMSSVQFSGGEPLLYRELRALLEACAGKCFKTVLSTNGILLKDADIDLLGEIDARVVTSVDGEPSYHDWFRGKNGAFCKVEGAIEGLVRRGIVVKVVTTVCEENFDHVAWCASWAHGAGVDTLQFQPLERVGRGREMNGSRLDPDRLCELFIRLNDLAARYASKGMRITMTYQSRQRMLEHPCLAFVCNGKRCHRGVEKELKKIIIREDGDILPELVDIDRRYIIGNLHHDTLENSLRSYLLSDGYSRFDALCRKVYADTVSTYPSPLIPWNEILTEESRRADVGVQVVAPVKQPAATKGI